MLYDVFICHASEDKEDLVRPLAIGLREARLEVWYDEFELRTGDSLRRAIDRGLSQCRFGVVVLSPAFFEKDWPQWELDGLLQRDLSQSGPLILPVWHGLGHAEVLAVSPSLADKVAASSDDGPDQVVAELLKVIQPEGSTLLVARDLLIGHGITPPVVTDDWWLDVVEYAGSRVGYEPWEFPLNWGESPRERGSYVAWAAMQLLWTHQARERGICQVTNPDTVLDFVGSAPGLATKCYEHPQLLAVYAPQLTLSGLGGRFETLFEEWGAEILAQSSPRNGPAPAYDSELNFRLYPKLKSDPDSLACQWVQGEMFGPSTRVLEPFEHICWILSERSSWLPPTIRSVLRDGLKKWDVWQWHGRSDLYDESWETAGRFADDLRASLESGALRVSPEGDDDLHHRMSLAAQLVGAPEQVDDLLRSFREQGFGEAWLAQREASIKRNSRDRAF